MEKFTGTPPEEAALLKWWIHLGANGELVETFGPWAESLRAFIGEFSRPDMSIFSESDADGWEWVVWSAPFMGGQTLNFWIRLDRRGEYVVHRAMYECIWQLTMQAPVTMFVTRHERVMKIARHFGATVVGEIPYFFFGDTAYIGYITPFAAEAAWNAHEEARHGRQST
jgi:hypothetical protein